MRIPNQSIGALRNATVVLGRHGGIMPAEANLARASSAMSDRKKCLTTCALSCIAAGPGYWKCLAICSLGCELVFGAINYPSEILIA